MADVRELFEAVGERVRPEPGGLERQHGRQRRRVRRRRAAAIAVAAAIGLVVAGVAARSAREATGPTPGHHRPPVSVTPGPGLRIVGGSAAEATAIPGLPVDARDAAVSPDGAAIAFVSHRTGRDQIYLASIDGAGVHRLTDLPLGASDPAWSPDGGEIAFSGVSPDAHTDLYLEDVGGSRLVRLTHDRVEDYHPSWSPDGSRIAINSVPDLEDPTPAFEVRSVDVATGATSTIARTVSPEGCQCGLAFADVTGFQAAWSPDGDRIAFLAPRISTHAFRLELRTVPPDAGSVRLLATLPRNASAALAWSPDGTSIGILLSTEPFEAYSQATGTTEVETVEAATGATRIWVPDAGAGMMRIAWLPDGSGFLVSGG
jgi:dipeptidyl aminopeptidase/acylaminoacyl peptidase